MFHRPKHFLEASRSAPGRWFLQTGLAGLGSISLANGLLSCVMAGTTPPPRKTSVILFWLSGGPSHIDMWDPKPDAPGEVQGPFSIDPDEGSRHSHLRTSPLAGANHG